MTIKICYTIELEIGKSVVTSLQGLLVQVTL